MHPRAIDGTALVVGDWISSLCDAHHPRGRPRGRYLTLGGQPIRRRQSHFAGDHLIVVVHCVDPLLGAFLLIDPSGAYFASPSLEEALSALEEA